MSTPTVSCARCGRVVPSNEADFCADGMLCYGCAHDTQIAERLGLAGVGPNALAAAERAFQRSVAQKHLVLGVGAFLLAVPLAAIQIWAGAFAPRGIAVVVMCVIGGAGEIWRGLRGLARLPPPPSPADDPIAKAYLVKR